jgi:hypothetical protein
MFRLITLVGLAAVFAGLLWSWAAYHPNQSPAGLAAINIGLFLMVAGGLLGGFCRKR